MPIFRKPVVYTCLFGDYERLNEQPKALDSKIPFICFTDRNDLKFETWSVRPVEPLGIDPARESRRVKILPHLFLSPPGRFSPPHEPTPTKARVQEINKSRKESRSIVTAPVSGEQVCFPLAEQSALQLAKRSLQSRQVCPLMSNSLAMASSDFPSALRRMIWQRLTTC